MKCYEIVGVKHGKNGCDYIAADHITDAKTQAAKMATDDNYRMVFVRQYYKDRRGGESYRVLHNLTRHAPGGNR